MLEIYHVSSEKLKTIKPLSKNGDYGFGAYFHTIAPRYGLVIGNYVHTCLVDESLAYIDNGSWSTEIRTELIKEDFLYIPKINYFISKIELEVLQREKIIYTSKDKDVIRTDFRTFSIK